MMYNLKRNGYFEHIKGIIVGGMTDMHDNEIPFGQDAETNYCSDNETIQYSYCF